MSRSIPKISVVIPAYNAERWLPETLASVAAQDVSGLEVIVVDDGSNDDTAAFVRKEWPQVRLISTENRGVSHARNTGTAAALGDLIQYVDADDLLLPGKLKRQEQLLRDHSEVDVIYSNWQMLEENNAGEFVPTKTVQRSIEDVHADPEIAFFSALWCPTGAYLFRRKLVEKILPWKEWLPVVQDARFAWDAAAAGSRWLHDPELSVLYRQHRSGSISTRNRRAFLLDCVANMDDIRAIWEARGPLTGDRKQALLDGYASAARGLHGVDLEMYGQVYQRLLQIDPAYLPSARGLRWATRLLGHEKAERLALVFRRFKAMSFKTS